MTNEASGVAYEVVEHEAPELPRTGWGLALARGLYYRASEPVRRPEAGDETTREVHPVGGVGTWARFEASGRIRGQRLFVDARGVWD